jgi:hypothetical protein
MILSKHVKVHENFVKFSLNINYNKWSKERIRIFVSTENYDLVHCARTRERLAPGMEEWGPV